MMDDIQIEEVGLNDSSQKSSDLKSRVQAKDIIMKNANQTFWHNRAKDLRIFYIVLHLWQFAFSIGFVFKGNKKLRLLGAFESAVNVIALIYTFCIKKEEPEELASILYFINVHTCIMCNFITVMRDNHDLEGLNSVQI